MSTIRPIRLTYTHLLPTRTQRIHMAGYAMTIAVSLACGDMIIQAQSHCCAFQYNAKMIIHGWSCKDNRTRLLNELFEYQTQNFVNTFMNNPLLLIGLAMCIRTAVFGMQSQRLVDIRIFLIWYDFWCLVRSIITSLQFTNCYLNLYYNISKLSMDDYFCNSFQKSVQPYYEVSIKIKIPKPRF